MWLLIFANLVAWSQASVWDTLNASIAVVEYKPSAEETTPLDTFLTNIAVYASILQSFKTKNENLDMIIFPESTLENDKNSAAEIKLNTPPNDITEGQLKVLDVFSYIAATFNTYLVINLLEREKCEGNDESKNCKDYGYHYYNTDVVFDRKGVPINRYRKYNLFGETDKDKPKTAEQVVIKTDFGVTFGIFTCFDILFKSPTLDLLSQNIDGIIFPTMWFSELPFLTAMQAQQMWSQGNDIAFFSAGANKPVLGSGGTGVYRGSKGLVLGGIVAEGGSQTFLYKSVNGKVEWQRPEDVDVLAKNMDGFELLRDNSVDDYASWPLNTSATNYDNLCVHEGTDDELCCNVTLKMSTKEAKPDSSVYTYQLVVFSGVRSFSGVYNGGIELCGIIACLDSSLSSCGSRFPNYDQVDWPVTFEEIKITANFKKSENRIQFPNSLLSSIRPIEANKTVWSSEEVARVDQSLMRRTWSTTEKQDRLLTFAIYGRNFEKDSQPVDDGDDNNDQDGDDDDDGKVGAANRLEIVIFWLLLCCFLFLSRIMMI